MASIRERTRRDGTTTFSVLWRVDGRQTSFTVTDRRDAEKVAAYLDLSGGVLPDTITTSRDAPTVTELVEAHISGLSGIEAQTIADYRQQLRDHITPRLGPLDAASVDRAVIAGWVTWLSERRAPKTVRNVHGLLSAAYTTGVAADLVAVNPCRGVRMPARRVVRPGLLIARDDYARILEQLDDRYRLVVRVLAGTGLRAGEAYALRVGDVDARARSVTVTGAVKRDGQGGKYRGAAKTDRSHRVVTLPAGLWRDVEPLLDRPTGDLLLTFNGERVNHRAVQYWWRRAVAASGVQGGPKVQDLRGSHASWLLEDGTNPKVVQERLGHEKISTTMEIYARVNRGADAAAAALLDDL